MRKVYKRGQVLGTMNIIKNEHRKILPSVGESNKPLAFMGDTVLKGYSVLV